MEQLSINWPNLTDRISFGADCGISERFGLAPKEWRKGVRRMKKPKIDLTDIGDFLLSLAMFLTSVIPLVVFIVLSLSLIRLIGLLLLSRWWVQPEKSRRRRCRSTYLRCTTRMLFAWLPYNMLRSLSECITSRCMSGYGRGWKNNPRFLSNSLGSSDR